MRLLLIKLLFYLLTRQRDWVVQVDEKVVNNFLATTYQHQGMHYYIHMRDMNILQHLGEGLSERDYLIALGRRMELNYLLMNTKKAHNKLTKSKNGNN